MRVLRLTITHFRGCPHVEIVPRGHVLLIGEPGAGRSDVVEALTRVLDVDALRRRPPDELDFYQRDTAVPILIEGVLGDLGNDLEQYFLERLELWDHDQQRIIEELDRPERIDEPAHSFVLRLPYRAEWVPEEEQARHWLEYAKAPSPGGGSTDRPFRTDLERLGFALLHWTSSRPLEVGGRSAFRALIERGSGQDFAAAVGRYTEQVENIASEFLQSAQVTGALEALLQPLRALPQIGETPAHELLRLIPEGGSASGLLRSLAPALNLGDAGGLLPIGRHGSTIASLFRTAETLALVSGSGAIIAADDFGEVLDPAAATHLAAVIRRSCSQVWLSTRRATVAEVFEPSEIVRLSRGAGGMRRVHQGQIPLTKAERLAARHWSINLLPALTSRAVIVVEGPHDRAVLNALARRLFAEAGMPLPLAKGVAIIDAGSADSSGGASSVPRLTAAARAMGLWTVGVIDWDRRPDADDVLAEALRSADAVVRLPEGVAIEKALLQGVDDQAIRDALCEAATASNIPPPHGLADLAGAELQRKAVETLKSSGGVHVPFIDALAFTDLPPLARQLLDAAVTAAAERSPGHIQL